MLSLYFGFSRCGFELRTDSRRVYDFWAAYTSAFNMADAADIVYTAQTQPGCSFWRDADKPIKIVNEDRLIATVEKAFLGDLTKNLSDRRWRVMHAAALAEGDAADVYLGQSDAGKSTWCVHQIKAGRTYLSDELVAVKDELVMALPRPICFRNLDTQDLSYPDPADGFMRISYVANGDYEYEGYCPPLTSVAPAGKTFSWRSTYLLEREPGETTRARLLAGPELRARLALSTFRQY